MSSLKETAMRWLGRPNRGQTYTYTNINNAALANELERIAAHVGALSVRPGNGGKRGMIRDDLLKLAAQFKPEPPADFDEYHGGAE